MAYVVVAGAWIVLSDSALVALGVGDVAVLQTYKGLMFVGVTATVLYISVTRWINSALSAYETAAEAEHRLLRVSETVAVGIMLVGADGRIEYANPAALRLAGVAAHDVAGQEIGDVCAGWMDVAGRPVDARQEVLQRVLEGNTLTDMRIEWSGQSRHSISLSGRPLQGPEGVIEGAAIALTDLSGTVDLEHKMAHVNRVYRFLGEIAQLIVGARHVEDVYGGLCDAAVEYGGFVAAVIARVDTDTDAVSIVSTCGLPPDHFFDVDLSRSIDSPIGTLIFDALEDDSVAVNNQVGPIDRFTPFAYAGKNRTLRSCAAFPIGKVKGSAAIVVLFSDEVGFFDEAEVELLCKIRQDIAFASERLSAGSPEAFSVD